MHPVGSGSRGSAHRRITKSESVSENSEKLLLCPEFMWESSC